MQFLLWRVAAGAGDLRAECLLVVDDVDELVGQWCRDLGVPCLGVGFLGGRGPVAVVGYHDLGLEESLSGIIHDLVAQLGFGNVLAQLLNTGALGGGAVLVDDLVALPLGTLFKIPVLI